MDLYAQQGAYACGHCVYACVCVYVCVCVCLCVSVFVFFVRERDCVTPCVVMRRILFPIMFFTPHSRVTRQFLWVWSVQGIFDLLSLLPDLAYVISHAINPVVYNEELFVLSALRVLRVTRINRLFSLFYTQQSTLRSMSQWILHVLLYVLIMTGIVQAVLHLEYPSFGYNTALYYLVVTLTTVGYGDFTPKTSVSRGIVTAIVFFTFPLTMIYIAKMVQIVSRHDPTKENFKLAVQVHVYVCYFCFVVCSHLFNCSDRVILANAYRHCRCAVLHERVGHFPRNLS